MGYSGIGVVPVLTAYPNSQAVKLVVEERGLGTVWAVTVYTADGLAYKVTVDTKTWTAMAVLPDGSAVTMPFNGALTIGPGGDLEVNSTITRIVAKPTGYPGGSSTIKIYAQQ